MNLAVEVHALTHSYGPVEAIHELDLSLPEGEILGLIGPNGAGKTTTLRILSGDLAPRSGRATVLRQPCHRLSTATRSAMGIASERLRLPDHLRVATLLEFCRGLRPTWDPALAERLRASFEIDTGARVRSLSRGQRAKLVFLLAVACRPRLLLLDEPFGGVDPLARTELLDELLALVGETGCSVIVATHDLTEVERITDRVALLHGGRLVFCEPVESVLARHRRVRLTLDEGAHWDGRVPDRSIGLRREGRIVEYVESAANGPGPAAAVTGARVEVRQLDLEEIFVAWARHLKGGERS